MLRPVRRLALAGLLLPIARIVAQPANVPADSLRPLAIGYGVDTSAVSRLWGDGPWREPVPAIYRAWQAYLTSRHGPPDGRSAFWNAAELNRWPDYDLAAGLAYQGFSATVVDIRPARPSRLDVVSDTFVVKTLFSRIDSAGGARVVKPVVLTRVYAWQETGRWVFGNALGPLTHAWPRYRIGAITFIVDPAHRFDRQRARQTARFADSLAIVFDVPRLARLDYYVTDDPDQMYRLLGMDWTITPDPHGAGQAFHRNRQLFVGAPSLGEGYRHEVVHAVLGRATPPDAAPMVVEGLATWLGGSLGFDHRELQTVYARYLRAHPDVTLDRVIAAEDGDYGWRPGAAVLFQLADEHGGLSAVRTLLSAGRDPDALRAAISQALGVPWSEVGALWRRRALEGPSSTRIPASGR